MWQRAVLRKPQPQRILTMSDMLSQSGNSLDATERRLHARHPVKSLAYLDIGPDNGGIVVNISEGGLAIHAVSGLPQEPVIDLRIQLPRSTKRLEARGKIAWTSGSRKDAGVEFIDLAEEARSGITEWLSTDIAQQAVHTEDGFPSEPTQPPRGRSTDKWTSLAAELASQSPTGNQTAAEAFSHPPQAEIPRTAHDDLLASTLPDAAAPMAANDEPSVEGRENDLTPAALTNELADLRADILSNGGPATAAPAVSPESTPDGGAYPRQRNAGLSLPSDMMLNTTSQGFAVFSGSKEKAKPSNASRTFRGSRASAAPADDFLTKARALFSVKRAVGSDSDSSDPASILESGVEPVATVEPEDHVARSQMLPDSRSQNGAASPLMELPFPEIPAASEPILAKHAADSLRTDSSARKITPDARSRAAGTRQTARHGTGSGLTLGTSLGVFGFCLVLAVACLGLGVVVGRRSAKPLSVSEFSNSGGSSDSSLSARTATDKAGPAKTIAPPDSRPNNPSDGRSHHATSRELSRDTTADSQTARDEQRNLDSSAPARLDEDSSPAATRRQSAKSIVASQRKSSVSDNLPAPADAPASATSPSATSGIAQQRPETTLPAQPPPDRLVPAHAIYRVEPFYPRAALQQGVEGTVKIRATVDRDGKVKNLKVISGPALLTASALDAAQYWRYIPSLRNGEPIETEEEISIEFHLTH
jgi:TonB family protein